MEYTRIKNTDLGTSIIGLGTGNLGVKMDEQESFALMDRYLELGGNFIDTARVYSNWVPGEKNRSERIIGDWMEARNNRENLILATKGGHPPLENMEKSRLSYEEVKKDLEGSLQTLRTPYVDLYYLHRDDTSKPVSEIMDYLHEFQKSGKIKYYGCSNWTAARIKKAQDYCRQKDYDGFAANQMLWNIGVYNMKAPSDSTLEMMNEKMYSLQQQENMAAVPYTSQAQGFFTKLNSELKEEREKAKNSEYNTEGNLNLFKKLQDLTSKLNMNMTELVLSYLFSQEIQTIPLVGCSSISQLEESLLAAGKKIPREILQQLEEITSSGIKH